jgi:large subunit ribosomal protein L16
MLEPKNPKHRKQFRGKMKGVSSAGNELSFGEYGLQARECGWVSARQIESARRVITGHLKRKGRVWVRIFPDKPITKKPAEVKMGSGKGDVEGFVAVVKPGRIMFEVGGVGRDLAIESFRLAMHKLPIGVRNIERS